MKHKLFLITKYLFVMIAGVIIYEVCMNTYARIRFNHEYKALETSHDYDELYQIQSTFFQNSSSRLIVYAVLSNSGISATQEARLASLDVIKDENIIEPAFSFSGAIVFSPHEGLNDLMEEVRTQSLNAFDIFLSRNLRISLNLIAKRLPDEPSRELLNEKISFLARYLFMDEKQLRKQAEEDGVESIVPIINERIWMLTSEEEKEQSSQSIDSTEDYESHLQEFIDTQK